MKGQSFVHTTDFVSANELEVTSLIALWLLIHGGDPPPQSASEITAIAGQMIASLSRFAFGEGSEISVDALRKNLQRLNVHVKDADGTANGVTPDFLAVGGRYLIWPNPGHDPIIVPIPRATKF
jgi:hypothetical protein